MYTSARNQLTGRISTLKPGPISAEVTVDCGAVGPIVAQITQGSVERLGLATGKDVIVLIKASSIIIVPAARNLRLSTRNQLTGRVASTKNGPISGEVTLMLPGNTTIAAVITNDSLNRLQLKAGDEVSAVFKASSVILGVTG
jgi:molybdate transport system regulatory protein